MGHEAHQHHHHDHGNVAWSDLTFTQLWSPTMFAVLVAIFVIYLFVTTTKPTPAWRKGMFGGGLLFIYLASGSPLAIMGHDFMFSAHMLQQSILYLIVPPLILLGMPAWWFEPLADNRWAKLSMRIIQHPLFALLNFNVFFSFYHIPHVFDTLTANHWMHIGYHIWLQFCAVQMWLLIINPLPVFDRLRPLQKIGYIFANGVLLTPACALIIFADSVLYQTYANLPMVTDVLTRLDDQQLGGVIMKLTQEGVYGLTLGIIFYRWYYSERAKEKTEQLASNQTETVQTNRKVEHT